jgi:hypothetical protein
MSDSLPDCLPECKTAREERNAILSNDDDFRRRRSGPGVFYADGVGELQVGTGADRKILPSNPGFDPAAARDIGDGKGNVYLEHDPAIALSSGGARATRRVYRLRAGNTDWNVRPIQYGPRDALVPRLDGTLLPAIETRVDPALGVSKINRGHKPVLRSGYIQWAFRAEEGMLWKAPTYWITAEQRDEFGMKGAREGLHQNKLVFFTGGQSSDQVAMTWKARERQLSTLLYDGNSTQGFTVGEPDFLVPDQWYTFEAFISDQYDAPVNDDKMRKAVAGPIGYPRFVAYWGAKYGEKPQLLGYTNHQHPARRGGAAIPSRWTDDRNPIFKRQDANSDDYGYYGGRVIRVISQREFLVVRDSRARNLKKDGGIADTTRYHSRKNMHWNPGRMPGWAAGHQMAFSGGANSALAYVPKHPILGRDLNAEEVRGYMQFEVIESQFTGEYVDGVEVHRFVLDQDAPAPIAEGDAVMLSLSMNKSAGVVKSIPGHPETAYYYAEPIFSTHWVDFPHQPGIKGAEDWVE